MCEFCKQAIIDINAYKKGYGEKFLKETLVSLYKLRNDLCEHKATCVCNDCVAQKLIDIIDNDPDINKKK